MSKQIGLEQDRWVWEREKYTGIRAGNGKYGRYRDAYEMSVFDSLSRLGIDTWIIRSGVELSTHYDGLQVYQLRKTTYGVDQLQTLLVTPEGEVLDFRCEPKYEEIPRPPKLTKERAEAILREKGMWPRRRRRR